MRRGSISARMRARAAALLDVAERLDARAFRPESLSDWTSEMLAPPVDGVSPREHVTAVLEAFAAAVRADMVVLPKTC